MSTAGLSDEQSVALFQRWDTLSEDDKKKEILKVLEEPESVEKFTQQCKEIGHRAVVIDTSFKRVKESFDEVISKYDKDFPEVKDYAARWDGFRARWDGAEGLLWKSRDMASFTASELDLYHNVLLELVASIETEEDLKDAQAELRIFGKKEHPSNIDPEIAEKFKELRNDLQKFSEDFTRYLEYKKEELQAEAGRLQGIINQLMAEIEQLNGQIKKILIVLGVSAIFALGTLFGTVAILGVFIVARNKKQVALEDAEKALAEVNRKQQEKQALQHLQTEFEGLKPDIQFICDNLAVFAEVWESVRKQALEFANLLDQGLEVVTRARFKLTLRLARKTAALLKEGLRIYATAIVNPP